MRLGLLRISAKVATNFFEEVEGLLTKGSNCMSLKRLMQRCGWCLDGGTERSFSLLLDQQQLHAHLRNARERCNGTKVSEQVVYVCIYI